MIACARREAALRRRVYPTWVLEGRLAKDKADREIELMEAIVEFLEQANTPGSGSEPGEKSTPLMRARPLPGVTQSERARPNHSM